MNRCPSRMGRRDWCWRWRSTWGRTPCAPSLWRPPRGSHVGRYMRAFVLVYVYYYMIHQRPRGCCFEECNRCTCREEAASKQQQALGRGVSEASLEEHSSSLFGLSSKFQDYCCVALDSRMQETKEAVFGVWWVLSCFVVGGRKTSARDTNASAVL